MSNLINDKYNISDDEIRIIGYSSANKSENADNPESFGIKDKKIVKRQFKWLYVITIMGLLCSILTILLYIIISNSSLYSPENIEIYHQLNADNELVITSDSNSIYSDLNYNIFTGIQNIVVNDVELTIYTPHNSRPLLYIGEYPQDRGVSLVAQAADIRADNGEIVGACVQEGLLLSKGQGKRGFCAIIGDSIIIGMKATTPYLEMALDENGDFFRQYSLIHDGKNGERTPKGKSIRRALCYDKQNDRIIVVETKGRESYNDFKNALLDLPDYDIQEAIALVGSVDITFARKENGETYRTEIAPQENTTYLVWRQY